MEIMEFYATFVQINKAKLGRPVVRMWIVSDDGASQTKAGRSPEANPRPNDLCLPSRGPLGHDAWHHKAWGDH